MKKIDLHLHTVSGVSDSKQFEFSITELKTYVEIRGIDAIAITNHNLFDEDQFLVIEKELSIKVFPGIEIDLEKGHLLIICERKNIGRLTNISKNLKNYIVNQDSSLTFEEFTSVFDSDLLSKSLLIPHHNKNPEISQTTREKINTYSGNTITSGEVSNHKLFVRQKNKENELTPVLFSDMRLCNGIEHYSIRQTYLDIDEVTLSSIIIALNDKHKVSLSREESNTLFELPGNVKASTGLNIVLGQRSSGKTHFLNEIEKNVENTKYIKQFELIEKNEKESRKRFDKELMTNESIERREYLSDLEIILNNVIHIDSLKTIMLVQNYIDSLVNNAKYNDKNDSFSKAYLYQEEKFKIKELKNLDKLIESVNTILSNNEYEDIIESHIDKSVLSGLIIELIDTYRKLHLNNLLKTEVNDMVQTIQAQLQLETRIPKIEELDLIQVAKNKLIIKKFDELIALMKEEKTINNRIVSDFTIETRRREYQGAGELKNESGKNVAFSPAYESYDSPFQYLQKLKEIDVIEQADFYKYFIKIEVRVLNEDLLPVSGGQRAEYNFIIKIQDALQYDLLLLDEPESSFDNIFLNKKINEQIKRISELIPVFVSTHNSTIGTSINPNYLIHTKRVNTDDELLFKIFTGYPTDKFLQTYKEEKISNLCVQLDCLEAGELPYNQRRMIYETLRD